MVLKLIIWGAIQKKQSLKKKSSELTTAAGTVNDFSNASFFSNSTVSESRIVLDIVTAAQQCYSCNKT